MDRKTGAVSLLAAAALGAGATALVVSEDAAPPPKSPAIEWTAPTGGTVSGQLGGASCEVKATAGDSAIARVRFDLDGELLNNQIDDPFNCKWDTTTVPNGSPHKLTATAFDTEGDEATVSVAVVVNQIPEPPPPTTTSTTSTTSTTQPPPVGAGYPQITGSEVDVDGGWATSCSTNAGPFRPLPTEGGATISIDRNSPPVGQCSVKFTNPSSGSQTRAELERSASTADPHLIYETLVRLQDIPGPNTSNSFESLSLQTKTGDSIGGRNGYNGDFIKIDRHSTQITSAPAGAPHTPRYLPMGSYPTNAWFAVMCEWKFGNPGFVGPCSVDPDGTGPLPYEQRLARTSADNNSSNGTGERKRFRVGSYRQAEPKQTTSWINTFVFQCLPNC